MSKLYYNPYMTYALKKTIKDVIIFLFVGFVYYMIYRLTGWGLPCAFRKITGLPCPSCGISHMFIHMAAGDFKSAYKDNQFLFFTWPLVAIEIIYMLHTFESKKDLPKWNVVIVGVFAALLTTFGVLRIIFSW